MSNPDDEVRATITSAAINHEAARLAGELVVYDRQESTDRPERLIERYGIYYRGIKKVLEE